MKHSGSRTRRWIDQGLMTSDGLDLTPAGERRAEQMLEDRRDHGLDDDHRMPHGWAPDPYPGGSLV